MAIQRTRVLMTTDTIGGVWSYCIELLHALVPYHCQVLLATLGAPLSSSQRRAISQLPDVTVAESHFKLEWMKDPWADVDASGAWLLQLAREFRPHLVHLNTFAHGSLPWNVPVLVVGHSCVLSWWQAVKGEAAPPEWATYQQRVQHGLAHANMVVAPTSAMMGELKLHYGPFSASQVIYNARNPRDFRPADKEEFIFTMGRVWDEAKNIAILDELAEQLPWPIYVAGEPRHPAGGKVALANLHMLGHLSQVQIRDWLSRASIFVLPARYEPFGLGALEAALSGCALVLGDILSLREVWGTAAIYAPPHSSRLIQQSLEEVIEAPARRASWAKAARTRAQRYTPGHMGQTYWTLYQDLMTRSYTVDKLHVQKNDFLQSQSQEWRD